MSTARLSLRWTLAILPALLWLGGCGGPASVTALRRSPHRVYSFEVPADCETTFLRIARRAREQYSLIILATRQPGVTARLAPDGQSAVVTLFNAGGLDLQYLLTADLHALDPARTAVDAYCADGTAVREAQLWQQWANTPLAPGPEDPNQ